MAGANPRTTSDTYNSDRPETFFPADSTAAVPTGYFSGNPVPLANNIEGSISSTLLALETAPPYTSSRPGALVAIRGQAAAEAAAAAAAVASVATAVHEPAAVVSTANALASAPRSVIGTAVASVPTAVQEPTAAVATADALASAPRSVVGTAVASVPNAVHEPAVAVATADASALAPCVGTAAVSVPTVIHEPAVAVATANDFSSAPSNVVAPAVASTGIAVHESTVSYFFTPAPHSAAAAAAGAATFEIKLRTADRVESDAPCTDMRASGARSAAVELIAPCTTTSRDTTTPEYRSPPRPPLPPLRPAPLPRPPLPR